MNVNYDSYRYFYYYYLLLKWAEEKSLKFKTFKKDLVQVQSTIKLIIK